MIYTLVLSFCLQLISLSWSYSLIFCFLYLFYLLTWYHCYDCRVNGLDDHDRFTQKQFFQSRRNTQFLAQSQSYWSSVQGHENGHDRGRVHDDHDDGCDLNFHLNVEVCERKHHLEVHLSQRILSKISLVLSYLEILERSCLMSRWRK